MRRVKRLILLYMTGDFWRRLHYPQATRSTRPFSPITTFILSGR